MIGNFEGTRKLTRQQAEMTDSAIRWKRSNGRPASLETLCHIWHNRISPAIPVRSILEVYDYLIELGYYAGSERWLL